MGIGNYAKWNNDGSMKHKTLLSPLLCLIGKCVLEISSLRRWGRCTSSVGNKPFSLFKSALDNALINKIHQLWNPCGGSHEVQNRCNQWPSKLELCPTKFFKKKSNQILQKSPISLSIYGHYMRGSLTTIHSVCEILDELDIYFKITVCDPTIVLK